jgi:5-methylcytosine-specific restriction endonuclease McrA
MAAFEHRTATLISADCGICALPFVFEKPRSGRRRKYCSAQCKQDARARRKEAVCCDVCGADFFPRYLHQAISHRGRFCSNRCWLARLAENKRIHESKTHANRVYSARRRARKQLVPFEDFDRKEIFDRDGWICGICSNPVDHRLSFPDHLSASLDHVVPLSKGGSHTKTNSQCSHWICNSRKTSSPALSR